MKDGTFKNKRNQSLDGYQASLVSMACNLEIEKKLSKIVIDKLYKNIENETLPNDLRKPIIRKFRKKIQYQWIMLGMSAFSICKWSKTTIKGLGFYYMLLAFITNALELFHF